MQISHVHQGHHLKKSSGFYMEGGESRVDYELISKGEKPVIRLKVADCGFETLYTEIRYRL
jgi:hypothetical protein